MYHTPQEVVIGLGNKPDHEHFDDARVLQQRPGPHKIHRISVQYDNEHVWGIKICYQDVYGELINGESSERFHPFTTLFTSLTEEHLELGQEDFIKEITGFADVEINSLTFTTYKGISKRFGQCEKGDMFRYHYPQHTFGAAKGSFKKYIDFLEFQVVRLPEQFIEAHNLQVDASLYELNVAYQGQKHHHHHQENY